MGHEEIGIADYNIDYIKVKLKEKKEPTLIILNNINNNKGYNYTENCN